MLNKTTDNQQKDLNTLPFSSGYEMDKKVFRVPEGYHEKLSNSLLASIKEKEHQEDLLKQKVARSFWEKAKPYLYLAAMFIGILLMSGIFLRQNKSTLNVDKTIISLQEEAVDKAVEYITVDEMYDAYLEDQVAEATYASYYLDY